MVIVQVFQHLWGTTELLSSFDSINILTPGSHVVSTDDWLHCDQAPLRRGTACIQGIVNMVDVGPDTGKHSCKSPNTSACGICVRTVVLARSHRIVC